ncbi:MAG: exopolyphosphatase [Bryobacteraceae bacterium]|nr:MAG: exopolyphosphatase [Bryobacteraceae bacterium]
MPRYAAIDIGSNSVRMMAADVDRNGRFEILAEDRQVTRLGESVFRTGSIDEAAARQVLEVLARMKKAYSGLGVLAVRAVATAAVRDASNSDEFLRRASDVLGEPVEMISGLEEARLIHLGVETRWPHPDSRILILDIGGGSAEVIDADNGRMRAALSRPLGAVRLKEVFLRHDPPLEEELLRMNEFIQEKLHPVRQKIPPAAFARLIGTSASASAIVCAANRIPRQRRQEADRRRITAPQLRRLYREMARMSLDERRRVTGIGPRRAEIIVPGVAVMLAVVEMYQAPRLYYSAAGVRDGILRDLAERGAGVERVLLDAEQRRMVEQYARRFGVDLHHARRVAHFARELFTALTPWHRLQPEKGRLLKAAAYLRDTGHAINDMAHHKHSQYIVANADLGGFTDEERHLVAMLCRYHRKAPPSARHADYAALSPEQQQLIQYLYPLLRVADALDRSRDQRVESISCTLDDGALTVTMESDSDLSLELWAVERAAAAFRQVYGKQLRAVVKRR